jgi:hypothetical protein
MKLEAQVGGGGVCTIISTREVLREMKPVIRDNDDNSIGKSPT